MAFEVITLNLIPSGDVPVIHAAQYDVDRPLKFALKLGEDDFNPSGYTLELQIRKVDNNIVTAAPSDVTSNVVTFNTTEQMCACSGTNLGEIQITKDDLDIATLHFYLVVQRDVLAGGLTSASEIHDLEEQIAEIVPSVIGDEYYTADEVDEKIAEIPTFDPSDYYDKTQLYTKTETNGLLAQKANTSSLATVATSGSYNDLTNKPNIPDVSDYYTKEETYSQNEVNSLLSLKADTSSLATVATTGDYSDLLNKPTIPAAQVNSDWNSSSGVSEILNKPTVAQYGTELPMSSTDPDKVADRITALESGGLHIATFQFNKAVNATTEATFFVLRTDFNLPTGAKVVDGYIKQYSGANTSSYWAYSCVTNPTSSNAMQGVIYNPTNTNRTYTVLATVFYTLG